MSPYAPPKDLHLLPKVRDSWSFLYVERCRIDQEDRAIAVQDASGTVSVPCASLAVLMLGPGTSITHAAVGTLANSGCLVIWAGEENVRFYAHGMGETRSARNIIRQARLASDPASRLGVVRRMYEMRFQEPLGRDLTLEQIRGKEGIRVREAYAAASRSTGVAWQGRSYRRDDWGRADPINRALSAANSSLYGVCHAAIVSVGFSPALGFIHTGKMLSFVYDIADLYKTELTIPIAFELVARGDHDLERRARIACRETFHAGRLLKRIIPDIELALGWDSEELTETAYDADEALPGGLWDPQTGEVAGGVNRGDPIAVPTVPIAPGPSPINTVGTGGQANRETADAREPGNAGDLVTAAEIARRTGAKVGTVYAWRRRHASFPAPAAVIATLPVWRWADVRRWVALERRPGRPRKAVQTEGQQELVMSR